jgi:hypothetical protein
MTLEAKADHSTSMPESAVLHYGLHPSDTIRKILQKRQRSRQMEQHAWAQGGGGIPQDQNHIVNEVQSINQVETNV